MKRAMLIGVLALATAPAGAQVVVRAPGVYVEVGPAVVVRALGVEVIVPRRAPKLPPADPDVPPVPQEEERLLPAPKAAPAKLVRAVTLAEFVSGAKPFRPGAYEVVFVHPHTGKPIQVNFDLPVSPRRVSVTKTRVEFRWGLLHGLTLFFDPDGSVLVRQT